MHGYNWFKLEEMLIEHASHFKAHTSWRSVNSICKFNYTGYAFNICTIQIQSHCLIWCFQYCFLEVKLIGCNHKCEISIFMSMTNIYLDIITIGLKDTLDLYTSYLTSSCFLFNTNKNTKVQQYPSPNHYTFCLTSNNTKFEQNFTHILWINF